MAHVVITGGSRGIGAAAVRTFCQRGDRVSFLYAQSRTQAEALSMQTGAAAIQCDVADPEAVREAFDKLGAVDVLICNAAIAHQGLVTHIGEELWHRLFEVNVHGMYRCICAALPGMIQRQSGCIISVASMWGQVGASCEVAYSATKGAVIAMTKALAQELGPSHIRVNAVSPGLITTDMTANLTEETLTELHEATPLGCSGTPEDVAQAMLYLVDAPFVTGQILPVNGGFVIT